MRLGSAIQDSATGASRRLHLATPRRPDRRLYS